MQRLTEMTGNDVVDITAASKQSHWRRPGFLKKIFTEMEQLYIFNSENPELIVWLLWSMKESAYKIYVQQNRHRFFAPLQFECKYEIISNNIYTGNVSAGNSGYTTISEYLNNVIYTSAFPDNNSKGQHIIYEKLKFSNRHYETHHKEIYRSAVKKTSRLKGIPLEQLTIKKNALGVPELLFNKKKMDLSISISHHGHYGAYIISEKQIT
ncbi:MAG: 4'-phosphopantetheinyl transferase superfamily protein [Ignavibacteriaceae bacterium]